MTLNKEYNVYNAVHLQTHMAAYESAQTTYFLKCGSSNYKEPSLVFEF